MDAHALGDRLFRGLEPEELPPELRARLLANVEGLMAATSRSAARGILESDVVLVAANENGEEERFRASSQVLRRVSTGFDGLLLNCGNESEIKLWSLGIGSKLHPIGAARWVMEVVHAVDACDAVGITTCGPVRAPTSGLAGPPPALSLLVAACQIADCWDCPSVLSAAAGCLSEAARLERHRDT